MLEIVAVQAYYGQHYLTVKMNDSCSEFSKALNVIKLLGRTYHKRSWSSEFNTITYRGD